MKWLIAIAFATLCVATSVSAQPRPPIHGIIIRNVCGGISGRRCEAPGTYCAYATGVCGRIRDAEGTCKPRPKICSRIYAPVCGCDGRTYGNSCGAAAAGVSVSHVGKCLPPRPPGIWKNPRGPGKPTIPSIITKPGAGFPIGVPVDRPQTQVQHQ